MADCSHDCGSCGSAGSCSEKDFREIPKETTKVKKLIGVISGKGGVGKSSVTSMLAVAMRREGYKVAVMDADITGPSIPRAFGVTEKAQGDESGIYPVETKTGIKLMSMNLLLANDSDPVVWRGPVIGGAVKQFWTDVYWEDVDYMFVDMPPGTGDVALTVFQSLPIDGIIIVTTPQDLVAMIVEKAVKMAGLMNVPVLGMVENMSYFKCPECGMDHAIFGISNIEAVAMGYGVEAVAKLPINPGVAAACDRGLMEDANFEGLDPIVAALKEVVSDEDVEDMFEGIEPEFEEGIGKIAVPYENGEVCAHFGHCPQFKIYKVKDMTVVDTQIVDNGEGGHTNAVRTLWQNAVEIVICGNIGASAADTLGEAGIFCIPGVTGDADDAVRLFLAGELIPEGSGSCGSCSGEGHEGGCCGCH